MKKLYNLLFICLVLGQGAIAQQTFDTRISRIKWLEGKWERLNTRSGETAFEQWSRRDSELVGEGITIRGVDTVFVEKLSIRSKDGTIYYVAEVSQNEEPTYFEITQISDSSFVSVNPDHDFPKKIEYKLENPEKLKAIISGNGKSIAFQFRRTNK